jgi:CheY-like chemotaxis protein
VAKPVLLVDDDDNSAFTVESILSFLGLEVDRAENGRVALAKTAGTDYAVVLMDIEMPEMDGMDATKAIRAREAETGAAPVLIVAMTGHTSQGIKVLCKLAGMDNVLVKPFGVDALRDKLAEVCGETLNLKGSVDPR